MCHSLHFLQLLEKKKRVQLKDMGEDLECLCQIMRTVGPRLDHEKAKVPSGPNTFKWLVHPKMKILSVITHPHVVPTP